MLIVEWTYCAQLLLRDHVVHDPFPCVFVILHSTGLDLANDRLEGPLRVQVFVMKLSGLITARNILSLNMHMKGLPSGFLVVWACTVWEANLDLIHLQSELLFQLNDRRELRSVSDHG